MARNHGIISFREMDQKFLLVKDIDRKTRMMIEGSGFHIRQDDNAMVVYGYIDRDAGVSFELLCAACVFDDGEISLEPGNKTASFKFRYGSFQGDMVPFPDPDQLVPFRERAQMIRNGYGAPEAVLEIRSIRELDPSRAPGFPDDVMVFFVKEGYRSEGIWCRTVGADPVRHLVQMRMLNEPNAPFGRHMGDVVDVTLIRLDSGEVKAAAVF